MTYFSWEICGDEAIKTIDISVLKYRQTGIPIQIREYWGIDDLSPGCSKQIIITLQQQEYKAEIKRDLKNKPYRTKMYWDENLAREIKRIIPIENFTEDKFKMRFTKTPYEGVYDMEIS